MRAREVAAEPDPLLGSTFTPAARGADPSAQSAPADVARLQRQVTDQQRQIEALAQALQEKDATIRQLQVWLP